MFFVSLAYQTIQMTCSRCKKSMMKGQTAFQKKGFTDVFCSKNCLFEIFPINKPAAKTCHYCQKWVCENYLDYVIISIWVNIVFVSKADSVTNCLSSHLLVLSGRYRSFRTSSWLQWTLRERWRTSAVWPVCALLNPNLSPVKRHHRSAASAPSPAL